ncbi:hypothetical protein [Candidatus Marinarcus aquaticus]|uniref:Uncharacterized protein n=1 Tax=Candidatus Marinarcus aquaticus TaxID=2044504 RepID=A0A4Q0XSV8_9BACT|nr:hypothetical protein [Candidatus Marinarcus aquaticus]RXJ60143.1 hypothetical protein CRV04_03835 [Candidatus Marinarcus aquaticus]
MTQEEKKILIQDIKLLINSSDEPLVEINPKFLEYFTDDELMALRDDLIVKKRDVMKNNSEWLNDIYEKTKKDEL